MALTKKVDQNARGQYEETQKHKDQAALLYFALFFGRYLGHVLNGQLYFDFEILAQTLLGQVRFFYKRLRLLISHLLDHFLHFLVVFGHR